MEVLSNYLTTFSAIIKILFTYSNFNICTTSSSSNRRISKMKAKKADKMTIALQKPTPGGGIPKKVNEYPCCGERAYRFELLDNCTGCQFREHVPKTILAKDAAVFGILENFRKVIDTEPPELIFPERLTRLVARDSSVPDGKLNCTETFWWEGLQIVPPNHQHGLLDSVKTILSDLPKEEVVIQEDSSEEASTDSASTSSHSEESPPLRKSPLPSQKLRKRRFKKKMFGSLWQLNLSARSNQDLQRSNEEALLTKMITRLCKKNSLMNVPKHKGFLRHVTPPGGIYARLEAEWREANFCTNHRDSRRLSYGNRPKIKTTRLI